MVYAYSEHYVLPISHDEVVYGKGSVFGKMPGNDWQKYAGVRALFAYQWAHPGKNLTFMGNEIAQYGEWDHDGSIDWDALEWPDHQGVQKLVADLNELYLSLIHISIDFYCHAGHSPLYWIAVVLAFACIVGYLGFSRKSHTYL